MTQSNLLCLLLLCVICVLYQSDAFSMKIHPIDSPHLKILPKSFTMKERQHFLRNISLSRAFYASKRSTKLGLDSIRAPLSNVQSSYFVTRLTLGSQDPALSPIVILDTSADQTWIQCASCNPCFNLKYSYPVEQSDSYVRLDPADTRCSPKLIYKGSCGFEASFGKGHTLGYMGTDTFIFNDEAGYFPNIAFGCGINNTDFSFGNDTENVIAGIHGLGIGPKSMMTQLDLDIKGRFTYCIRSDNGSSTIMFGDDAQIGGSSISTIPVQSIAMNPEGRYHLHVAGITVEGQRLKIKPSIFQLDDQAYTSGFFIDPSAPFTVLTHTAYQALRGEIEKHFSHYQMDPVPKSASTIFDLCYSNPPDMAKGQVYPTVTFNFVKSPGGSMGEVKLLFDRKHIFGKFGGGFCLQMLPTENRADGPSIFGAAQQTNIQFLFDINDRLLSFIPKEC